MITSSNTPPPVVEMHGIYKYHFTRDVQTAALNGLNLKIYAGDFVAITGPSGSGKSTLL
jgi:putative ABC transport system ATP-binding protein